MTRFARAKGSKASNERVFADPTPWHEMKNNMLKRKQEIEDEKKRKEAEAKRNENYQKFLKEREEETLNNTEWAEFPVESGEKLNGLSKKSKAIKKQTAEVNKKKLKNKAVLVLKNVDNDNDEAAEDNCNTSSGERKKKKLKIIENCDQKVENTEEGNLESKKISKKKNKKPSSEENVQLNTGDSLSLENDEDDSPLEVSSKVEIHEPVIKKTKAVKVKTVLPDTDLIKPDSKEKKGKNKKRKRNETEAEENVDNKEKSNKQNTKDLEKPGSKEKKEGKNKKRKRNETEAEENVDNKKKPNKQNRKVIDLDSLPEEARKKILKKREKRIKQVEKKKLNKKLTSTEGEKDSSEKSTVEKAPKSIEKKKLEKPLQSKKSDNVNKGKEEKNPKKRKLENGEVKRRKDFKADKIMVNGNEVELEYFDGFPIKKEDAQHLRKLKREMISKGLPRSEINRTLKLERRKAEKALAREKKKVCFNCRKYGHNLSECPSLTNKEELVDTAGSGICFKCGSAEHTSFACRVVRDQTFKFATCFICKEQGHISRQCPDNARGLYPKGGSCRVCGDVTHLKKDCPQYQEQQKREEAKYQVDSILDGNPDDLDSNKEITRTNQTSHTPKVIKF